jgi:menaquinone-dependent protoporphyrinogen oxidase
MKVLIGVDPHRASVRYGTHCARTLGPLGTDEREIMEARNELDEELEKYPWLIPVALEIFGGKYDPAQLRFSDRLIAKLPASPIHGMPPSDVRDWTAIRSWAGDLAQQLRSSSPG